MNNDSIRVLVIDDEPNMRAGLAKGLASEAVQVDTAQDGAGGLKAFEKVGHEVVVTDLRLPGGIDGLDIVRRVKDSRPETLVIVITAYGTVETAVDAMRHGAFDFVTKPVDLNVIRHQVRKAGEHYCLQQENRRLRERLVDSGDDIELVGNCAATRDLLSRIRQIAETDATVLMQGESGTGKELIARAIHRLSPRHQRGFVAVNLGALPETLLESEMFGYEKGAFTGASRRKPGCFEEAAGGTLFLDEITETSPRSQVDLLRVLEQQEFRRLGGEELIQTNVRVISATNQDIGAAVSEGRFREDLYYRLNVIPLEIPPLRERRDDVPLLVEHFLKHFCQRHQRQPKTVAPEAMRALLGHRWPGNIRQLKNLIERLVVVAPSDIIHLEDLPNDACPTPSQPSSTLNKAVEEAEKQAILAALAECNCHRERTAKLLDISVRSLHYKMNRYGLH